MTPPWLADRRYYRPNDARRRAGLTYDDIAPTESDDAELKRSLGFKGQNGRGRDAFTVGLGTSWLDDFRLTPNPYADDPIVEGPAWEAGIFERNKRRQDAVVAVVSSLLGRKKKCRGGSRSKRPRRRGARAGSARTP